MPITSQAYKCNRIRKDCSWEIKSQYTWHFKKKKFFYKTSFMIIFFFKIWFLLQEIVRDFSSSLKMFRIWNKEQTTAYFAFSCINGDQTLVFQCSILINIIQKLFTKVLRQAFLKSNYQNENLPILLFQIIGKSVLYKNFNCFKKKMNDN